MKLAHKTLAVILFSFLLIACGKSKDGSSSAQNAQKPYVPQYKSLQGRLVKGVVSGALVEAFQVVDDEIKTDQAIASGVSDDQGYFSIAIDDRIAGQALVLKASVDANTAEIVCDLLAGCGSHAFGDRYMATESFELSAGISKIDFEQSYYISALTDIGLYLAEHDRTEPDFLTRLNLSYAELSTLFGLPMPLERQAMIDITDIQELADASTYALSASLLNSAIVAAAPGDDPIVGLSRFKEQLSQFGIPGNTDQEFVSRLDVYQQVEALLALSEVSSQQALLSNQVSAETGLAFVEKLNDFQRGSTDSAVLAPAIDQAKQFVKNLRQVAASIDLNKLNAIADFSSLLSGDAGSIFADFGVDVEGLKTLSSDDSQVTLSALTRVLFAVLQAHIQDLAGDGLPQTLDGIALNPSRSMGTTTFTINENVDACRGDQSCITKVNLQVTTKFEALGGNANAGFLTASRALIKVDGVIEYGETSIEFDQENQVIDLENISVLAPLLASGADEITQLNLNLDDGKIQLPFVQNVNSVESGQQSLKGRIEIDLSEFKLGYKFEESYSNAEQGGVQHLAVTRFEIIEAQNFSVNIAGLALSNQEDSFLGSLSINGNSANTLAGLSLVSTSIEHCEFNNIPDSCMAEDSNFSLEGETQEKFAALNASIILKSKLKGVVNPLLLKIVGSRTSPSTSRIEQIRLSQPDNSLVLSGEFTNNGVYKLDAINQNGVVMKIEQDERKERTGYVKMPSGEIMARIKDMNDWIKITFIDGYFESM